VATLDVGRICMKVAGREAGRYCVVLKKLDKQFVLVTGPKDLTGVKRRRCNIDHLEATGDSLSVKEEASETEVIKAYEKIGFMRKFGLKRPSPEVIKEAEKKVKKVEKKPEKKKEKKKPEKKEKPKKEKKPKEKKAAKKK